MRRGALDDVEARGLDHRGQPRDVRDATTTAVRSLRASRRGGAGRAGTGAGRSRPPRSARRGTRRAPARAPRPDRAGGRAGCPGRPGRTRPRRQDRGRTRCGRVARPTSPARASRSRSRPLLRGAARSPREHPALLPAGQSQPAGSSTSIATTSAASRRSISNAQNPLKVPTSRQRLPASDAGNGIWPTMARWSSQPGVTTPGASSSVWYQSSSAISSASATIARP